jgi:hypothetical protein
MGEWGNEGMREWGHEGSSVIPSERSEPVVIPSERSEPVVIPSERSESRDLHLTDRSRALPEI